MQGSPVRTLGHTLHIPVDPAISVLSRWIKPASPGVEITRLTPESVTERSISQPTLRPARMNAHLEDNELYKIARARRSPAWARPGIQVCWACPVAWTSGAVLPAFLSESGRHLEKAGKAFERFHTPP